MFLTDGIQGHGREEAFIFVYGLSLALHPKPLPDFSKMEVNRKVWADSDFSQFIGLTRPYIR